MSPAPAAAPPPFLRRGVVDRRAFLGTALGGAATLALAACGSSTKTAALSASAALPTTIPPGTALAIASEDNGLEYKLSGVEPEFGFKVSSWVNIGAGPDVINAFRAHSLDVSSNAGIPPIQAHYQGDQAKIVSIGQARRPNYLFITAPHSSINNVADFKGKKLAFSQGQAQGVVLLRALQQAGISFKQVDLVPLTSDQFLTALEANQVDVAVSGGSSATAYIDKFGSQGARIVRTSVVDFIEVWWSPSEVLQDSAKVAAIRQFIQLDAQASVWVWTHKAEWIQQYYVKTQNITQQQAEQIVALEGKPWYPASWDAAISWEQETADLMAEGGFVKKFDVSVLFDRRFEGITAAAVPATYRT
jgi:sulfonate transport system substrate-binding protein